MAAVRPAMSSRGHELLRTGRAFFEELEEHKKTHPVEYADIMASAAAHVRSAAPMAMHTPALPQLPEEPPVETVTTELADGSRLRISSEGGCTVLHLADHEDSKAVSTFTPIEALRFRHDFGRVAARGGR